MALEKCVQGICNAAENVYSGKTLNTAIDGGKHVLQKAGEAYKNDVGGVKSAVDGTSHTIMTVASAANNHVIQPIANSQAGKAVGGAVSAAGGAISATGSHILQHHVTPAYEGAALVAHTLTDTAPRYVGGKIVQGAQVVGNAVAAGGNVAYNHLPASGKAAVDGASAGIATVKSNLHEVKQTINTRAHEIGVEAEKVHESARKYVPGVAVTEDHIVKPVAQFVKERPYAALAIGAGAVGATVFPPALIVAAAAGTDMKLI